VICVGFSQTQSHYGCTHHSLLIVWVPPQLFVYHCLTCETPPVYILLFLSDVNSYIWAIDGVSSDLSSAFITYSISNIAFHTFACMHTHTRTRTLSFKYIPTTHHITVTQTTCTTVELRDLKCSWTLAILSKVEGIWIEMFCRGSQELYVSALFFLLITYNTNMACQLLGLYDKFFFLCDCNCTYMIFILLHRIMR